MQCAICACCDQKLYRDSSTNAIYCGEDCQYVAYSLLEYVKPTHVKYAYEWTLALLEKDRTTGAIDKWVKLFSTLEMQRRWKTLMMNYARAVMSSESMDRPIAAIQQFMDTEYGGSVDVKSLFDAHQTQLRAYYRSKDRSVRSNAKRNALKYAEQIGKRLIE